MLVWKWEDHDAIESDIFDKIVEEVRCRGPNYIRVAIPSLRVHVLLEDMGLLEPRDAEIPRGRPPRRENARKRSWFEQERSREARRSNTSRTSPPTRDLTPPMRDPTPLMSDRTPPMSQLWEFHSERDMCPYLPYIPSSIHHLVRAWFNPDGDGHCGFRAISHIIHGDKGYYLEMRQAVIGEITSRWDSIYSRHYDGTLEQVIHRLDQRNSGWCGNKYWFEEVDLLAFATMHNCAFSVFGWAIDGTYGYSALPVTAPPGITSPVHVYALVHTRVHWVRLHLVDVGGVTPCLHLVFSGLIFAIWQLLVLGHCCTKRKEGCFSFSVDISKVDKTR
ncbi:unnamed protein product, partial [Linum tenue]